jgi:hypothetical protein
MIKLIQNKETMRQTLSGTLSGMQKYMFNSANMQKLVPVTSAQVPNVQVQVPNVQVPLPLTPMQVPLPLTPMQVQLPAPPTSVKKHGAKPFIPFQKDKLFWCFYIILNGYEAYEMNHSASFSLEKQIKIETVEKLKSIKEKLKELKLKRTELEDELVNKPMITLKGLYALCLVHDVSITYIYGRKYCEINTANEAAASEAAANEAETANDVAAANEVAASEVASKVENKKGIIIQNAKKEDSLKWTSNEPPTDFLTQIKEEYWLIENIQKPLKAASAYTLQELQDICGKLQITTLTEKNKAKTKTKLYEEIIQGL